MSISDCESVLAIDIGRVVVPSGTGRGIGRVAGSAFLFAGVIVLVMVMVMVFVLVSLSVGGVGVGLRVYDWVGKYWRRFSFHLPLVMTRELLRLGIRKRWMDVVSAVKRNTQVSAYMILCIYSGQSLAEHSFGPAYRCSVPVD